MTDSPSGEKISILEPGVQITDSRGRLYEKVKFEGQVWINKTSLEVLDELRVLKYFQGKEFNFFKIAEYRILDVGEQLATLSSKFYPPNLGHKALEIGSEPTVPSDFSEYLPLLGKAIHELMKIQFAPELPLDQVYRDSDYHTRAETWTTKILEMRPELAILTQTLLAESVLTRSLPNAFSHGNLWQDHLAYDPVTKKIIIFDLGSASNKRPIFYDALFFTHRLYTGMRQPELAIEFWESLKKILNSAENITLMKSLYPILSLRAIGGLFDAINDPRLNYEAALDFAQNYKKIFL